MKDKKLLKLTEKKEISSEDLETEAVSTRQKEEERIVIDSKNTQVKEVNKPQSNSDNANTQLSKLIVKPSYLNLVKGVKLVGNFGHGSAILKRPVLEGNFFMEFIVREDAKNDKKTTHPSAVRVGICVNNFDTAYPLGCH